MMLEADLCSMTAADFDGLTMENTYVRNAENEFFGKRIF